MTPLAQCFQIILQAIFGSVVEVGNRKHDVCVLTCLRVVSVSVIFYPTELASVICSFQNPFSYLLPILRIARFVFGFNGHFQPPSSLPPSGRLCCRWSCRNIPSLSPLVQLFVRQALCILLLSYSILPISVILHNNDFISSINSSHCFRESRNAIYADFFLINQSG